MSTVQPTWEPHEKLDRLSTRSDLPDTVFAFPKQRKEPLTDAQHVRNAIARFDQVLNVSDADRALAFANIEKAARHYEVDVSETNWHQLGIHPQQHREESAAKAVETKRERRELAEGAVGTVETRREHGTPKAAAAQATGTDETVVSATRRHENRERANEFSEHEEF